jgi:hypothetical protein
MNDCQQKMAENINGGENENPKCKAKKTKVVLTEVTDSDTSDGGKGMYSHQYVYTDDVSDQQTPISKPAMMTAMIAKKRKKTTMNISLTRRGSRRRNPPTIALLQRCARRHQLLAHRISMVTKMGSKLSHIPYFN